METKQTKAQLLAELLLANDYNDYLQGQVLDLQGQIEQYNSVLFAVSNAIMAIQAKDNHEPLTNIMTMIGNYCHRLSDDLYEEDYYDVRLKQLKLIIDGINK
jgi:hypothetical protein